MAWSLTKLWHSDQRFIKNILTPLLLKICLNVYVCVSCSYSLIIHAIYKFLDMAAVEHSNIVDTLKYMGLKMMS